MEYNTCDVERCLYLISYILTSIDKGVFESEDKGWKEDIKISLYVLQKKTRRLSDKSAARHISQCIHHWNEPFLKPETEEEKWEKIKEEIKDRLTIVLRYIS